MDNFRGVMIEESLGSSKEVLKLVKILSTKVEDVTLNHATPWLSKWTLHAVEVPEDKAKVIAEMISQSLDYSQGTSWYADFKNSTHHYIIFRGKIFYIDRSSQEEYDKARDYGLSLGIPGHQVDFHPKVEEWER